MISAAEAFQPDVVIVLDHERLFNELQHDLPSFVKILHFPKSGGAEMRSREQRKKLREAAIHKVFIAKKKIFGLIDFILHFRIFMGQN